MKKSDETQITINDFGEQWTHFTLNKGYYGSQDVLIDILGPFFHPKLFAGKIIIDVGAGTGRITNLLVDSNAKLVIAVEPSDAYDVLVKNTASNIDKVRLIKATGDEIPQCVPCDLALSIGVLHHIPLPLPTLAKIYSVLKNEGIIIIWLYGAEGNRLYLLFSALLRKLTINLSHENLLMISKFLLRPLKLYSWLCKNIKLPMHDYMRNHISKLDDESLLITIYDQLNPTFAKYYTRDEALNLLRDSGFVNIEIYHRHGYSYTVKGQKIV